MILHVVLIEPHPHLSGEAVEAAVADLQKAATAIRSVRRVRVGRRVRHGLAAYEQAMSVDYVYAAMVEFDDRTGLEEYLQHPFHAALSRHFSALGERRLAYDYEVTDLP